MKFTPNSSGGIGEVLEEKEQGVNLVKIYNVYEIPKQLKKRSEDYKTLRFILMFIFTILNKDGFKIK